MTETIQNTLRDSKAMRWFALGLMTFAMFAGYLFTEILSPLKGYAENIYGWNGSDWGFVSGAYSLFNVFFGLLLLGGLLLDKLGVRFSTLSSCLLMVVGAAIKYWAFITPFDPDAQIMGWSLSVFFATLGYAIFGVGIEYAGITVTKATVKWFKGKEMALAMGLQVSFSRLGTFIAMYYSGRIVEQYSFSTPFLIGLILLVIGFFFFVGYNVIDKKLDQQITEVGDEDNDIFRISDIRYIVSNRGFWYISILCLLFYSAVLPFTKYGPDLMVNKFGIDEQLSGDIPSMLPLGSMILTPLFGWIYDKRGKGASMMLIGSFVLIVIHLILFLPSMDNVYVAAVAVIFLGISFSLVPSAMWPSVPKIIAEKHLGSAYALIFWVQNIGLWGIPFLLGYVLDQTNPQVTTIMAAKRQEFADMGLTNDVIANKIMKLKETGIIPPYDYTQTWIIFIVLSVLAFAFALLLKKEDKRKNYGLELPNEQ